jgi:hypothetical protein
MLFHHKEIFPFTSICVLFEVKKRRLVEIANAAPDLQEISPFTLSAKLDIFFPTLIGSI